MNYELAGLAEESSLKDYAASIILTCSDAHDFNKADASAFLDAALANLRSAHSSPASKLMTLMLFVEFTERNETKLLSLLTGHPLLKFLYETAEQTDPRKAVGEKGGRLFGGEPETGKKFMRVLLELIRIWAERYGKSKSGEPTKLFKFYQQLSERGVVFPKEYAHVDVSKVKKTGKKRESREGKGQKEEKSESNFGHQLEYTRERILLCLETIGDAGPEELEEEVLGSHKFFEKELQKYEAHSQKIQETPEQVELYFAIFHFLTEEANCFQRHIPNNDLKGYAEGLRALKQQVELLNDPKDKNEKRASDPEPVKSTVKETSNRESANVLAALVEKPMKPEELGATEKVLLSNLYSRYQVKARSLEDGFKAVQRSLEKEKESAKQLPSRKALSPHRVTQTHGLSSSLKESSVNPIFSSPPNPSVRDRQYAGRLVPSNPDLERVLFGLKKEQGSRRFKAANLKSKSCLFENEHLQIGCRCRAAYAKTEEFGCLLELNVFFGNKTSDLIRDFQIEYKGGGNQLLYANPRHADSVIPAGYQNKHDLIVVPLKSSFEFIVGHLRYTYRSTPVHTTVALPNSMTQFAAYREASREEFESKWEESAKLKSPPFQLCRHFPPEKMAKWVPEFLELTRYEDFARPGSESDYEVGCLLRVMKVHEAALKVCVRPNLQMVIQVGVEGGEEARQWVQGYLEALQLVLRESE